MVNFKPNRNKVGGSIVITLVLYFIYYTIGSGGIPGIPGFLIMPVLFSWVLLPVAGIIYIIWSLFEKKKK